jgi:hypothetical protein
VITVEPLDVIIPSAAGWLAVPALWPGTEYFYATFALPLRSPWLAAALALSEPRAAAVVPWAIMAYAVVRVGLRLLTTMRLQLQAERVPGREPGPDMEGAPLDEMGGTEAGAR